MQLYIRALVEYAYSVENAKQALIADGWIYNSKGQPFVEGQTGVDAVRYKKLTAEEAAALPDEEITGFIETEDDSDEETTGRRKGIINIDSISEAYTDGEVVTLKSLIEKKLVAKNVDVIKVLARGVLDKALTVKAHDFSLDAAKMIVVAGGSVIKLKKK